MRSEERESHAEQSSRSPKRRSCRLRSEERENRAEQAVRAGRRREGKQKRRGRRRMRKRTGYLPAAGSTGSFFFEKYVEKWDRL